MMTLRRRIAAARLAAEFIQKLIEKIGENDFMQMCLKNVETRSGYCASHDYCDAYIVMDQAWKNCFDLGRHESSMRFNCHADLELWGQAWEIAKLWTVAEAKTKEIKMI